MIELLALVVVLLWIGAWVYFAFSIAIKTKTISCLDVKIRVLEQTLDYARELVGEKEQKSLDRYFETTLNFETKKYDIDAAKQKDRLNNGK